MRNLLIPESLLLKNKALQDKFDFYYNTGCLDSVTILVRTNKTKFDKLFKRVLRKSMFERLEGELTSASVDYTTARRIALVFQQNFNESLFQYMIQYQQSLTLSEIRQKLKADYFCRKGYKAIQQVDYKNARCFYERALEISKKINDDRGTSRALRYLSRIYFYFGEFEKKEAADQLSWEIADRINDIAGQIRSLYYRAGVYLYQYNIAQALDTYKDCLNLAEQHNNLNYKVCCYDAISVIYRAIGEIDKAKDALSKGNTFNQELQDKSLQARYYYNLGQIKKTEGKLYQAIKMFHESAGLNAELNNSGSIAKSFWLISELYYNVGKLDSSLCYLEKSLHAAKASKDMNLLAGLLARFGRMASVQNQPAKAMAYFRKAAKYLKSDKTVYSELAYKYNLANTYINMNLLDMAQSELFAMYDIAKDADNIAYEYLALIRIVDSYVLLKQKHQARIYVESLEKLLPKISDKRSLAAAFYTLGLFWDLSGNSAKALTYLSRSIEIVENIRKNVAVSDLKILFFKMKQNLYRDTIRLLVKLNDMKNALALADKARARSLIDNLFVNISQQLNDAQALQPSEVKSEFNNSQILQAFQQKFETPQFNLAELQSCIAADACLIEYYVMQDSLYVWLVSQSDLLFRAIDISSDSLRQAVLDFRQSIGADNSREFQRRVYENQSAVFKENVTHANALYRLLLEPIEKDFQKYKTIVFVPDGVLINLPFNALTRNGTSMEPHFFVEDYAMITAPSSALYVLAYLQSKNKVAIDTTSHILAVSVSQPDIKFCNKIPLELGTHFQNVEILAGPDITDLNALKKMQDPFSVVHFSAHGIIDKENPLLSRLVFYNPGTSAIDIGNSNKITEDGILTAREILQQNLSHISLVTLSSCETALGKYYKGEGEVGLTFAFLGSGVSAVVSTLWKVDDRFSYVVIKQFYQAVKDPDILFENWLRYANLKTIRILQEDDLIKYPFPYYWAAFCMNGYCK